MTMSTGALIFDFDGVLADTEPLIWKAWALLLASHRVDLSWDEYCRFGRGVTDQQMLSRLPQLRSNLASRHHAE
jgi:beta-phosphoglucomutase-like phosphatase (HAD superfamily)